MNAWNAMLLENGEDKEYQYYRRPGIVADGNGTILVYYEGQHFGQEKGQSLFCRVSHDNGCNWSERILLAKGGSAGMLHNIMMAYSGGRYHCLWNVQYRQLWHRASADGIHWDDPLDLTREIWRADSDYPWNAFGIGSGHCLHLRSGRILVPAWFTTGGDGHKPSAFGNIYTDDDFKTLHIGATLSSNDCICNPNEGAIVELSNGDVLATIRHDNPLRMRAMAISKGGVENWHSIDFRKDLPDPICHASMLNTDRGVLFCNCANADPDWKRKHESGEIRYLWSNDARKDLTIRISTDGGQNFNQGVRIADKGGYSDMAFADGHVICIYETGWNTEETCIFPHQLGLARMPIGQLISQGEKRVQRI